MMNSRFLIGTSTAMILGGLTGGLIMNSIEGNRAINFGAISGALAAGIAGGISSIKTENFCITGTKITASILTSAITMTALTGMLFAYLESDVKGETWGKVFMVLEFLLGLSAGTIGAVSSHYVAEMTGQNDARNQMIRNR